MVRTVLNDERFDARKVYTRDSKAVEGISSARTGRC